jgi:hypothetical protein
MLGDRRRHQRHAINRIAKFQTEPHALPRDVLITDLSQRGARLFVENFEVPDQFQLTITGERGVRCECKVVWRLGGEVGITFIGKGPEDLGLSVSG